METRANYLLIGAFTLAGLMGALGFLLWLAKVEVDRQFAYYDILFDSVAGLGNAGDVRLNGLPVGTVVGLELHPDDPGRVRVRVEIGAEVPIRTDTVATLEAQGVTGVSFVALSGGTADAPPLPEGSTIPSHPSPLQSVLQGAPELLQHAVDLLEDLGTVVDATNRAAVATVLENMASASGRLDRGLENFERIAADFGTAAESVAGFAQRLDGLAETADKTLTTATATLDTANDTLRQGQAAIARGTEVIDTAEATLQEAGAGFAAARDLITGDLTEFARQGSDAARRVDAALETLVPQASATLKASDKTLAIAERSFAAAEQIITEDLDGVAADIRAAATQFRTSVEGAAQSVDAVSQNALAASQSAAAITGALETVVADNRRQMSDFLRLGLPEFLRLAEEARQLVRNLERFVDQVERDPARFFLGTQGSEFRR